MKTAMEQALARIEMLYGKKDDIHWEMFKNDCMEKEKEQIIQAHNNAVISPYTELYVHKIQGKSPITKGEEYYNQNFNE